MTPVGELPIELCEEVLVRLPSRSLFRFKTVSKQWLKLITNNRFAIRHYHILKAHNFASFLFPRIQRISVVTSVTIGVDHSIRIGSNVNLPVCGLQGLISAGFGIYCVVKYYSGVLKLWNPTTRECIDLPLPLRDYQVYNCSFYYFGKVDYEDGVLSYNVGMVTARVDHMENSAIRLSWSVEFYSSKIKTWTFTRCYDGMILHWGGVACVNLNGKAHWVTRTHVLNKWVMKITTFDYENQVLDSIPILLAPKVGQYDVFKRKGILSLWDEAFLCLLLCRERDGGLFIDVWVMREYGVGDSWCKEFTVGPISKDARVLGLSSKEQALFIQSEHCDPTSLMVYDLKSSNIKELTFGGQNEYYLQIADHVESLVSLLK